MLLKINYICKKISMSKETIKIAKELERLPLIRIGDIQELQGNLKDLTEVNYQKLLKRLEKVGFKYPLYIWFDENKTPYTLDGKQRHRVIQKEYGADIKLPYIEVYAKNKIEAKKEILAISSDYGTVTKDGFDDFVGEFSEFDYSEIFLETTFDKWADNETLEAEEDNFEVPENIKTDIVLGDLFEIGEHRLLCGDSTCSDTVAKLMNGEKADMVLEDPPYNVDYTGKTKDALKIDNDNKSDKEFKLFLYNHFVSVGLNIKDGAVYYVFQPDKQIHNFINSFIEAGNKYSGLLVWNKDSIVMSRGDYNIKHETILYGWKKGKAHKWVSDSKQASVLEFERPKRSEEHPTMKPIALLSYLLSNNSEKNSIVIDGFLGSGSTMVAAHQLKRKCFGMELDPKYCDVIIQRMLKLDNTLTIKRNGIEETEKWLEKIES